MNDALDDILREIKNLAPLPQVALKVLEASAREDVIPRELIALIQTDAALTARVLKLSNSAYYGFRREIASLHEAGNLLGVSTLTSLVLTSCASRYFAGGSRDARSAKKLWERSVANALAASLLARIDGSVDLDRAYTAGLLQNIGLVVIGPYLQRDAARVQAEHEAGSTQLEAEVNVLGVHHAEVGARLAERWNFPEVLVDSIRCHHEPEKARVDPLLTCIVYLGEEITDTLDREHTQLGGAHAVCESAFERIGIDRGMLPGLGELLATELVRAHELVEAV